MQSSLATQAKRFAKYNKRLEKIPINKGGWKPKNKPTTNDPKSDQKQPTVTHSTTSSSGNVPPENLVPKLPIPINEHELTTTPTESKQRSPESKDTRRYDDQTREQLPEK